MAATQFGDNLERNKEEKQLKSAMLAAYLKLFTKEDNIYSSQPIKGRKEERRLYMSLLQKPGHWKRSYRKKLWGVQELQEQGNQESPEGYRMIDKCPKMNRFKES